MPEVDLTFGEILKEGCQLPTVDRGALVQHLFETAEGDMRPLNLCVAGMRCRLDRRSGCLS